VRQYTSPYCDVIRAKIVLLAAQGLSNDVIASRLDSPRQVVSKWRQRFCLARLPGLDDELGAGGRLAFSTSLVVQVKALACELPHRTGLPLSRFPSLISDRKFSTRGWWPRSAEPPSGAGSAKTPFDLGVIEVGFSRASLVPGEGRSHP